MGLKLSKIFKRKNNKIHDNLSNSNHKNFNHDNQQKYSNLNNNNSSRSYNREKEFSQYKRDILNYSLPLHYEQICEILQDSRQLSNKHIQKTQNSNFQNVYHQQILNKYPSRYNNGIQQPLKRQSVKCFPPLYLRYNNNYPIINRIPCRNCLACPYKCYKAAINKCKPKIIYEEILPLQDSHKKIFFEKNDQFSDDLILQKIKKVNFKLNSTNH